MSVLIRGIEIPTTCGKCRIKNAIECDRWKLVRSVVLDRHRDCPLIHVPAHGRLIDADVAYEQFLNLMDTQGAINPCQLGTILVDATTVIEAEEE